MDNIKDNFKKLSQREAVLLRPNMYIGSIVRESVYGFYDGEFKNISVVKGLLKIIDEIVDNAVDENIRTIGEYANRIDVTAIIDGFDGLRVEVNDNGRGIPIELNGGVYRPLSAWTEFHASSNFYDERETAGANGLGATLTNIYSKRFVGETKDGKNVFFLTCLENMKDISFQVFAESSSQTGTKVTFYPDLERFSLDDFDSDHLTALKNRLQNLSVCYPRIRFTLNGEKINSSFDKMIGEFSSDSLKVKGDSYSIAIALSKDQFEQHSYVNGLYMPFGGSHVDWFVSSFIDELRVIIKKRWKIDVLPNHIKQNLVIFSFVSGMENIQFEGQTKEKLKNSIKDVSEYFSDIDFKKLSKEFSENDALIKPIIDSILKKQEELELKELSKLEKKAKKPTRIPSYIHATSENPSEKMLFITEGLSAISSLCDVRDSKIHGGFPVGGKVVNISKKSLSQIAKNAEYKDLMTILNLKLNDPSIDGLTYHKIIITTDADEDGSSIRCGLINFFSMWDELFDRGYVYAALSPLYICVKGKQTQMFYTKDEFEKAKSKLKGWEIRYIKGLGSLTKDAYRELIRNPMLVRITKDEFYKKSLNVVFGDDVSLRKKWLLGENC